MPGEPRRELAVVFRTWSSDLAVHAPYCEKSVPMLSSPFAFTVVAFLGSIGAGVFGAMLGVGGGMLLVPMLTLALGVDIRYAIGASIVSVIATSSGAAAAYLRERLANIRVGIFLEIATVSGAIAGGLLAGKLPARFLFFVFGLALAVASLAMLLKLTAAKDEPVPPSALADRLGLHGTYWDEVDQREAAYRVTNVGAGMAMMFVAGGASGLLGIGSGALKVPALDVAMRLPLKVSTATSNFMIGVTAAASAGVYFARGEIEPLIAGPVCAGVLIGSYTGARYLPRARSAFLRVALVAVVLFTAIGMFRRVFS
jgi:uncharacterized membrane protein YfcA